MKFSKSLIALSLTALLSACGGGGSNGYYNTDNGANTPSNPNDPSNPSNQQPQQIFNDLKTEAASLFGQTNEQQKGYIDHAIATYGESVLKISQDIRKVDFTKYRDTHRKEKCFDNSSSDFRACYIFVGDEISELLGADYEEWDFNIDNGSTDNRYDQIKGDDLQNIRLKLDSIEPNLESYYGQTFLLVFENENPLKDLQDITISGSFSYPFYLDGIKHSRFILINEATSDHKVTVYKDENDTNPDAKDIVMGALSIYKVPQADANVEYYVTEAGSGFNTLVNDNTNVSFAEPVNFRIDSILGQAPSIFKVRNGIESLTLPSVTISGTRVEHETPTLNDQTFTGSIFLEAPNIFNFATSKVDSVLKFKHFINDITYEGESRNTGNGIVTTLTSPSNVKY